jgi:hypothetical protein
MTIYEIKELTKETSPYFFSDSTLRFFGQTMASFKVYQQADGRFMITAPCSDGSRKMPATVRYFNPDNNELERE